MARKVNSIEEVDHMFEAWKLAVKIAHLWFVQTKGQPSIEMGHKIGAIVNSCDSNKWSNQLNEGETYIMQNFEIEKNTGQYKVSKHPFKLLFIKGTIVKEQQIPNIPPNIYEFISFEDILSGKASPDVLVDVIGQFLDIEQDQQHKGKRKLVIRMRDQGSNTLSCTLWGAYATKLLNFLEQPETGPVIIILTLAKIKDTNGQFPISIQNSMYGSKLLINEDIIQIQEYKNSLDSIPICESFSQGISQFSQATQCITVDKFCINAEVKSVKEINEVDRDVYCVTVAKIDKFFVANGWKYDACSKCNTKGDPAAAPYICRGCGKNITETIIRYKLEVQVSHQKECAKFVLWDKQCVQLLGVSAAELSNQLIEVLTDGELDPMAFPEAIDGILGKTLAFRVKVQPTYGKSSVNQISDDAQIIESILGNLPIHEDPIISCNKGKSVLDVADLNDSQSFSATADYDPGLLGQLTPAKRQSLEEQLDDQGSQYLQSCQLSSNKLTKIIKTE
ncbi:hypothetical protein SESBI_29938 [Sesbania bispinosa]|nr:hypothetical protein SESBI_29938 [Sesbania bispinosa]